jgi:hypothetical protein
MATTSPSTFHTRSNDAPVGEELRTGTAARWTSTLHGWSDLVGPLDRDANAIVRHDLLTGAEPVEYDFGPGRVPGEHPRPAPSTTEETD